MSTQKRGAAGEAFAQRILKEKGYQIRDVNYHSRYGEIDIVAQKDEVICFVEVKARRHGAQVSGPCAVTTSKQRRIIQTALVYLQEFPCDMQPRFDVFALEYDRAGAVLNYSYLRGAFDGAAYHW